MWFASLFGTLERAQRYVRNAKSHADCKRAPSVLYICCWCALLWVCAYSFAFVNFINLVGIKSSYSS